MQPPKFEFADSARGNGAQNLGLDVQNCTKWVQNYDPVFCVETALGGAACHQPPQIWIADSARVNGVRNLGLGVQNCTK